MLKSAAGNVAGVVVPPSVYFMILFMLKIPILFLRLSFTSHIYVSVLQFGIGGGVGVANSTLSQ